MLKRKETVVIVKYKTVLTLKRTLTTPIFPLGSQYWYLQTVVPRTDPPFKAELGIC